MVDDWYNSFDGELPVSLSQEEENRLRNEIWQEISPQVRARTYYLNTVWGKAAAVTLLLASAGLAYLLVRTPDPMSAYTEISTKAGEKKTVTLEDGSVLVLNAGSTIRISKDLSRERKLKLIDGEVFFDVKGIKDNPFTVESGPLVTTVLGTSFDIVAYQALNSLRVGVISGKVLVKGNTGSADVLGQQQVLVFDKQQGTGKIGVLDQDILEWQQGKLLLNDASFEEMAVLMQKNFGITIIAEQDHVKTTRYTTELSTVMAPEKAAEVLAAIHHLKIKVINHQILIYE